MAQGMLSAMKVCPFYFWRFMMANIDQMTLFETGEYSNRRNRKPDVLKDIGSMDLESIVRHLGKHRGVNERQYIHLGYPNYYGRIPRFEVIRNRIIIENSGRAERNFDPSDFDLIIMKYEMNDQNQAVYRQKLLYIDDQGQTWTGRLNLVFAERVEYQRTFRSMENITFENREPRFLGASVDSWKINSRLLREDEYVLVNDREDLWRKLEEENVYTYEFAKDEVIEYPEILYMAPELEQLKKAGYGFVDTFLHRASVNSFRSMFDRKDEYDCFNRLCRPGKNPKEIFKTDKVLYSILKEETDIKLWDIYRKMYRAGKVQKDTITYAYENRITQRQLNQMNELLSKRYDGKPVFTWESLQNYMHRLDMFQAIEWEEGIQLLKDYLNICNQLEMEPRIDSDSLKREHDVAARILTRKRQEEWAKEHAAENDRRMKAFQDACQYMAKNDYQDGKYMIRAIRDYDDLLDEAKQQHNCVASYSNAIGERRSLIYVMRAVSNPNHSIATVEIDPQESVIRQRFLAYNQPIREKEKTDFLDQWIKLVTERKRTNADSIDEVIRNRKDRRILDQADEIADEYSNEEVMEADQWNQYGLLF